MEKIEKTLRKGARVGEEPLHVLGPAPSPIPRLRGRYREQLLLKGGLPTASKRALVELLERAAKDVAGVEFQVDVDPAHML